MKAFFLKEFDEETYTAINDNIKDIEVVYLMSDGGIVLFQKLIRDLLEKHNIRLVLAYNASSSGFMLFYLYRGPKALIEGCYGMIHKSYIQGKIIQTGNDAETQCRIECMLSTKMPTFQFLSKKERAIYEDGQDVYFNFDRLVCIFDGIQIMRVFS